MNEQPGHQAGGVADDGEHGSGESERVHRGNIRLMTRGGRSYRMASAIDRVVFVSCEPCVRVAYSALLGTWAQT